MNMPKLLDFDYKKLNIDHSFGNPEGEHDNLDKETFIITKSIEKFLSMDYTYVISPKGSGKTALFNALENNIIKEDLFDYKKYFIVNISSAFVFDNNDLDLTKFKKEKTYKIYILAWGNYLLNKIVKNIYNHRDAFYGADDFFTKISKYEYLKEELELYDISDIIQEFNIALSITIGGQPIEISPKMRLPKIPLKKVNLNEIFDLINDFFLHNKIKLLILIDRIDNFVKRESHDIQENYIQGLVSTLEEINCFSNIKPILFIRTDLYYSFSIAAEYDKIKQRTLQLDWKKDEVLMFILTRLLRIKYIHDTYFKYFVYLFVQDYSDKNKVISDKSIFSFILRKLPKKLSSIKKNEDYNLTQNLPYRISSGFIKLFMPEDIVHKDINRDKATLKFCDWLFQHFKDQNEYINPRVIVSYFNTLIKCQYETYQDDKNRLIDKEQHCIVQESENNCRLNVFMSETMQYCYEIIQNDELKKIYNLLSNRNERKMFLVINNLSYKNGVFKKNSINLKTFKTNQKDYDNLLRYLSILGFLKNSDENGNTYLISVLFMNKIKLDYDAINIDISDEDEIEGS